jgi:hypothetical protein
MIVICCQPRCLTLAVSWLVSLGWRVGSRSVGGRSGGVVGAV